MYSGYTSWLPFVTSSVPKCYRIWVTVHPLAFPPILCYAVVYVLYSLSTDQIIWAILTHSRTTEVAEIEDLVVADAHTATVTEDHDQAMVVDETVGHVLAMVDEVTDQRKCFQQHVIVVTNSVKCRFDQVEPSQSIAVIVSKAKKVETVFHHESQNEALTKILVAHQQVHHKVVVFHKNNLIHCI